MKINKRIKIFEAIQTQMVQLLQQIPVKRKIYE